MNSGCLQTDTVLESENLGAFWQTRLHLSYTELLYPFLPLQLRAVLHQLLQREAAAALHRADPPSGAGGVPERGNHLAAREEQNTQTVIIWSRSKRVRTTLLSRQIDYFNNQIIVDLVEQPHKGIISILDEACLTVGNVTDTVCLESMDNKLAQHPHYTSRKVRTAASRATVSLGR